jgi:hypothetical protein
MNVFETDYSKLFAAGLRVIQSRSKGRRSPSEHQHCPPVSNSPSTVTADCDHLPTASSRVPSSWKTFQFPARLWRLPSSRNGTTESAERILPATTNDSNAKAARRRSMPSGNLEETTRDLDVRIWDWSRRVSYATTILESVSPNFPPPSIPLTFGSSYLQRGGRMRGSLPGQG